jgi:putative spermidine/putrescine transport system substrate-binding protein
MSETKLQDVTPLLKRNVGPNRRVFVAQGVAFAAASAASWPLILIPGNARASEQLVIPSWGGGYAETINEAFYKPFTEETGIPIIIGPQPDLAKLKAMIRTGEVEWDVIDLITAWIVEGENEGLWEPIDLNIVDRSNVVPKANREKTQGFYVFGGGIIYDESRHGRPEQHPKSWAEYWDVDGFPGRRGLRADRAAEMLELALIADGVPPRELYPLDVERSFTSLDRIKPHINHWISATPQTIALVERNEVDFSYSYNSRVFASRKAGNPIEMVFNNLLMDVGYAAVVAKSKNKEAGMKLLNYYLNPRAQARWANLYGLDGTNRESERYVTEEVKKRRINFDDPNNFWADIEYWGKHNTELEKRYKEWLLI